VCTGIHQAIGQDAGGGSGECVRACYEQIVMTPGQSGRSNGVLGERPYPHAQRAVHGVGQQVRAVRRHRHARDEGLTLVHFL